jgi:serine/threonine protein kinase
MTDAPSTNALVPGQILDAYRIVGVLGAGGFGITYRAEETALGRPVAIKEYLPSDLAGRGENGIAVRPHSSTRARSFAFGLARFRDEARILLAFDHPNIVRVLRYFEAHGTGYVVMPYSGGQPLEHVLARAPTLPEAAIRRWLMPLLDGLEAVHAADFLHRDVKPANIVIDPEGRPFLIDFGAARHALGEESKTLSAVLSPGYAPFEQYYNRGHQGPWTDLYALGATLYRCITGRRPPEALERIDARMRGKRDPLAPAVETAGGGYAPEFLAAIDRALAVVETDRPQNVAEFRAMLGGAADARPAPGAGQLHGAPR